MNSCACNQLVLTREPTPFNVGKKSFQEMVLEQLYSHMQKNEVVSLPLTIEKDEQNVCRISMPTTTKYW